MKTRLFLPLLAGVTLALGAAFAEAPATTTTTGDAKPAVIKTNGTLTATGDGTVSIRAAEGTVKVTVTGSLWADSTAVVKFTDADDKLVKKEATKMDKVDGFTYTGFTGEVNLSAGVAAPVVTKTIDKPNDPVVAPAADAAPAIAPVLVPFRVYVDGKTITVTASGIGKVMMIGTGTYTVKIDGSKDKKTPKPKDWFVKPAEVAPVAAPADGAAPVKKDGTKVAQAQWVSYGKITTPKTPKTTTAPKTDVPAPAPAG